MEAMKQEPVDQQQQKSEDQDQNQVPKCQTIDCNKPAKFHCPTCEKLGLELAYFCSQECFKRYWPIHKTYHNKKDEINQKFKNFKFTGPLRPGKVSPRLTVPEHIKKPDYAFTGYPAEEVNSKFNKNIIEVKSVEDIIIMREVGIDARKVLDYGHTLVKPGVTTDEIDKKVHDFIVKLNAYPSPLNYHKFPKSLCTSVNEVICHGIPDDRPLEEGDIVNLDVTIFKNGYNLDLNETYHVGKVSPSSAFLVEKTYRGLEESLKLLRPGNSYKQIGQVISKYIEDNGLSVTRSYTGHGIGKLFHIDPMIPHYKNNNAQGVMKVGHVFTVEPMVNQGTYEDVLWPDDWTAVTADGQRSAQFENTFVITEGGYENLTQRLTDSPALDFNA